MRIVFLIAFSATFAFGQKLKITHLTGDFYIYTTYQPYKGNLVSANGMYLITKQGAVLFDTPWDSTQFQPLIDSIKFKHNKKIVACIATHFHDDRTRGLAYYKSQGCKTYTTRLTDEYSKKRGMKRAEFLMNRDTIFTINQYSFETFFPGAAHSPDNIVIWFPKEKILYGGCLVKSVADDNLGNLGDADQKNYANAIQNVLNKYKNPNYVIPGHDSWADKNSLKHTLKMAQQLKP